MLNILILVLLIVGGIFLFNSDSEEKKQKIQSKPVEPKTTKKEDSKKIKILYLDEPQNKQIQKSVATKQKEKITKREVKSNIDIDSMHSKETIEYIEQNNLVDITPHNTNEEHSVPPRFSVYSNITQEEAQANSNKDLPPMAPVIANGTFRSGQQYTVIIPALVKQNANKIIVTDNAPDGTPQEAVEIPTQSDIDTSQNEEQSYQESQENFTISPPSVGQN